MRASEPEVRANMLAGLAPWLAQRKPPVDLAALFEAAGLERDQSPDPNIGISLNSYSRLLELAAIETRDDCFGLHFAHAFPRGGTRALGYLMLNAPDLKTCITCLCRYVRLQSEAIDFRLTESQGMARLAIMYGPAFVAPRKQFVEFVMALIVLRLSSAFGADCLPIKAEFEYREPRCGGEYELLFGRNITFGAAETAVTIRADLLRSQSAQADGQLFNFLRDIADSELARLHTGQDIVWRVGEYIVANLAMRRASLEGAAVALERTARQLQTELKRHETTFDEELTKTRRSLAERYLRDTDMQLTEIALLLGFSELSAFTRAARHWLGMPPSQWRQQMRSRG